MQQMINVCDVIMGGGKTESAIHMMNTNTERHYLYVTPYLSEAERVKNSCPALSFVEPSKKTPAGGFSKSGHILDLIAQEQNIATTHQAFLYFTDKTVDLLKEHKYTLIIDEAINVLETTEVAEDDIELLVEAGYLKDEDGTYTWTGKEYHGGLFSKLMRIIESRDLVATEGGVTYWLMPHHLFRAFDDVYILTYMFEGQPLSCYLKLYDLDYRYIGVEPFTGGYRFCDTPWYVPGYVKDLKDRIVILDNERMNEIGDHKFSLSLNWYATHPEMMERVKKNLNNFFRYFTESIPADQRMWGSFKRHEHTLRGKGYSSGYLSFNTRATNEYRNKRSLAYVCNVFMNVGEKLFYKKAGIKVDEDAYALSVLIQWIWRSGIRDGETIHLYLPSRRMRELLTDWMDQLQSQWVDACA